MYLTYFLLIFCIYLLIGYYLFNVGYEALCKDKPVFANLTEEQYISVRLIFCLFWLPAFIFFIINMIIKYTSLKDKE